MMRKSRLVVAPLVVLALVASASAAERLQDPVRAFVEGFDPSGNDFLANVPERTVLLRIRADLDGDGRVDLAVSDSSTWGNAGGQWLLFRGEPDGGYRYWGTLFFAPGTARSDPFGALTVYARTGAARGTLATYQLGAHGITVTSQMTLNLEEPAHRARYEALFPAGGGLPAEHCRLLDYRRDPTGCWRPGLGTR